MTFNFLHGICIPFTWGKSSLSFQFWHILFSVVKNTLLCQKHFVELVNRVSGTKCSLFTKAGSFLSPPHSLGYCTFSDMIKTFPHLHEFFFSRLAVYLPGGTIGSAGSSVGLRRFEYLWSFLEMLCSLHWAPSCGRKPPAVPLLSHSKVAWTSLLCCTVLAHLSLIPTSDSQLSWFQGFSSTAERNSWVRGLEKVKCEFPGLLRRETVPEGLSNNIVCQCPLWDNCVNLCPSSLGRASPLGLNPLRGWRCRQGNALHVQIPEPGTTCWCHT